VFDIAVMLLDQLRPGVAWHHVAANGHNRKSAAYAARGGDVGKVAAAEDRWREARERPRGSLQRGCRSERAQDEAHHG
jgi:hypothetical protein